MDKTPPTRRDILSLLGVGLTAGLAGCNSLTDTEPSPDSSEQNGNSTNENPDISVRISTEAEPSQLPSIWNDHSIEDFQAEFTVETGGQPSSVSVSNENVEINNDSEQWNGSSVTVQPGQMQNGEQRFTATAEKNGATAEDTTQASKPTPGNYKLDIVLERNEELRNTIENNLDEENYLEARGGFVQEDPVFSTYSSHEAVGFDKLGVDLVAREWHHDNDYENLGRPADTEQFIQSIDTDTGDQRIQDIKSGRLAINRYPNGGGFRGKVGSFEYQEFANAETVGEALDWLHPYLFNWQRYKTDSGPISSEDDIYAPTLEQAIEQKNENGLEAHAWDFDLDEHGNGLIYGRNADGSDELRIMETVSKPITSTPQTRGSQLHPLVEDSNYLNPDHGEFNRYWHPLRFGWEGHSESTRWEFRGEKTRAGAMVFNLASSMNDLPESWEGLAESTVATTTEYLKDFTEKLRTYNENDADFEELYNQSKILDKMVKDTENNHVVYGDTENPQYAVVEDESVIEDIWEDEEGQYDDFNQFLRDNPSYSMSVDEVDATLEGEEMDEGLGQQTLAGA